MVQNNYLKSVGCGIPGSEHPLLIPIQGIACFMHAYYKYINSKRCLPRYKISGIHPHFTNVALHLTATISLERTPDLVFTILRFYPNTIAVAFQLFRASKNAMRHRVRFCRIKKHILQDLCRTLVRDERVVMTFAQAKWIQKFGDRVSQFFIRKVLKIIYTDDISRKRRRYGQ